MAVRKGSVTRADVGGHPVWIKRYGSQGRKVRLGAMKLVARRVGVPPLLPPPHHVGDAARATEQRRLLELQQAGVRVPPVLGSGRGVLIVGHIGPTLAGQLRSAPPAEAEQLFSRAARAIVEVHRRGIYLGQPQARNITVVDDDDDDGRIGFIDFEEDPGEVMTLEQAQARDWLVFAAGTAHHLSADEARMAELAAPALQQAVPEVRQLLEASLRRLEFVPRLTRRFGPRAAGLGKAVGALRRALMGNGVMRSIAVILLLAGVGLDYLHDGDLEAVELLGQWLD